MKILYVTNFREIAKHSNGFISDYLNDLCFYGLYELLEKNIISELIDSTEIPSLYKEFKGLIPEKALWGGFTSFWLIDKPFQSVNRKDIYPPDKIILLDGNDETSLSPLSEKHPYFKRELMEKDSSGKNIHPISFSMPACKITKNTNTVKTQKYGTVIPGKKETYLFKHSEKKYYEDYNKSFYGVTFKKVGWDCMRHYEILGNYCMPYFTDLENCPKTTLWNFPKNKVLKAREISNSKPFKGKEYFELLNEVFEYTKTNLTTEATAKYILDKIQ